jgi:hypothetical protein
MIESVGALVGDVSKRRRKADKRNSETPNIGPLPGHYYIQIAISIRTPGLAVRFYEALVITVCLQSFRRTPGQATVHIVHHEIHG